jgi:purine-binding chemotaxis protein CheW
VHFFTPIRETKGVSIMEEQLVVLELGGEAYGVNVAYVQSIIPAQEIVTVPGAPVFIEGVINLRGAVVPVIDLRARFGLAQPAADTPDSKRKSVIVIVEFNKLQVGLIVDKVTEVTKIADTAIEPPSPLLASVDTAYLRGIGKLADERVIILLDLARVFSMDEQQALVQTA